MQPTPLPIMVDDRGGEDDLTFFTRRPGISSRVRLPFQTEYPADVLSALGRTVMIRVVVKRDPVTHEPTIWRNAFHVDGGNA